MMGTAPRIGGWRRRTVWRDGCTVFTQWKVV